MTLPTSLFVPGTNVPRRLLTLLDRLDERKVALLTATAGSGKTQLVRAWIEADPERDRNSVVLFVTARTSSESVESVRSAVNEMQGEGPITVFVDNHDRIVDPDVLGELLDFVESKDRLRLILAGRMRPSVPLSGLAVRGQLVDINGADLALTRDEQRELLSRTTPSVSDDVLDQIQADYCGWLIALELLGNTELTPASLASAHTLVDGYLEEEVLDGVGAEDLELLEALSTLPDFTPVAAAHLAGRADASARLTYLSARGLPVEWRSVTTRSVSTPRCGATLPLASRAPPSASRWSTAARHSGCSVRACRKTRFATRWQRRISRCWASS